jgi:hypothetical protein
MLLAHAITLAEARSSVAALADVAQAFDASVEYERGVDGLQIELVLDMLDAARDKDEP